jgi:hypothetical protein
MGGLTGDQSVSIARESIGHGSTDARDTVTRLRNTQ